MMHEFVVWSNKNRLPSVTDMIEALAEAGVACRVEDPPTVDRDSSLWNNLQFSMEAEDELGKCLVSVITPLADHLQQMAEDYEDLPVQVKYATRKYVIAAESDEYGQATPFQVRVVATLASLTHGVIEDPQESGLMHLDEFENYIESA